MKKVFLDLGANNGQSIDQFVNMYEDSESYEIHSFECTKNKTILNNWNNTAEKYHKKVKSIKLYEKAVWIEDNNSVIFYDTENESSSLLVEKTGAVKTKNVETIDISNFIINNFNIEDQIIMKIDIEGAEYKVFEKMFETGAIKYINKLYGELHGPKCGVPYAEDLKLIEKLKSFNLLMFYWDATNDIKIAENYYTTDSLHKFHKKYNFMAG